MWGEWCLFPGLLLPGDWLSPPGPFSGPDCTGIWPDHCTGTVSVRVGGVFRKWQYILIKSFNSFSSSLPMFYSPSSPGLFLRVWQVLLRWAVQQGVPVLPKSSHPTRVAENGHVFDFELTAEDMERLGGMDCGQKYCWDPSQVA